MDKKNKGEVHDCTPMSRSIVPDDTIASESTEIKAFNLKTAVDRHDQISESQRRVKADEGYEETDAERDDFDVAEDGEWFPDSIHEVGEGSMAAQLQEVRDLEREEKAVEKQARDYLDAEKAGPEEIPDNKDSEDK